MQKKITTRQQGSVKMTPKFQEGVVRHLQKIGQIFVKRQHLKSPTAQRLLKRIEKPLIEHLQKIGQIPQNEASQCNGPKTTPEFYKNLVRYLQSVGRIPCDSTEETLKAKEIELEKMDPINNENWMMEYELGLTKNCLFCDIESDEDEDNVHYCRECSSDREIDKETCWKNKGYCDDCFMEINEELPEEIADKKELGVKCLCMNYFCAKCLGHNCEDDDCPTHDQERKNERRRKIKAVENRYYIPDEQEFIKILRSRLKRPASGEGPEKREEFIKRVTTTYIESVKKVAVAKVAELEEEIKWIRAMIARSELDTETDNNPKLKKLKNPKSPIAQKLQRTIEKPLIEHLQKIGQIRRE